MNKFKEYIDKMIILFRKHLEIKPQYLVYTEDEHFHLFRANLILNPMSDEPWERYLGNVDLKEGI